MAILPSPVIITDVDGNSITAATQATLASVLTELQSILTKLNASLAVTGTFYQATQPISAASLPTHGVTGPLTDAELRATAVPISGTVTASGPLTDAQLRAATVPVSGTVTASGPLTDAQLRAAVVPTSLPAATTPAQSTVSVLITSTTILAPNAARRGATIYNESGAIVFVKLGATASITSYTAQVAIGGYYEVPYSYTGTIDGITAAITAVVRVTEFT